MLLYLADILRRYEGKKKTELELELEDYLLVNSSTLSNEPRFAGFYTSKRRSESSPVKKEAPSLLDDVETKTKAVRRRVTRAAEDFLATTYVSGAITRFYCAELQLTSL